MKRFSLVVALAGVIAAAWYLRSPDSSNATPATELAGSTEASRTPSKGRPIEHVTRFANADERRRVADQIAAARAARAAISAPQRPSLPEPEPAAELWSDDLDTAKTTIKDAMLAVRPDISKCYEDAIPTLANPDIVVKARMTFSGDPDIGTLIDADQLFDDDTGEPLPAKFDDCLRSTFQSFELPPLAEGDQIVVNYPFTFRIAR